MDKKTQFKPYGDVYWNPNSRCYNIFGMEISPELLKQIGEGGMDGALIKLKWDIEDNSYIITKYSGFKGELEALLEKSDWDGSEEDYYLFKYISKCYRDIMDKLYNLHKEMHNAI